MKPVDLAAEGYENVVVYAEDQTQYEPLPSIEVEPGLIWTRWQLTEDERRAIIRGARVELWTWTFGKPLQPIALTVEGVERRE